MDKEEALGDFFQSLHAVINTAFAYVKDHPYFLKSLEEFKAKLDQLFRYSSPLKITVNPESLFVDGRSREKIRIYVELAQVFHLRKIKSIEFRPGVSLAELTLFFSRLCLPAKEIIRGRGLANIPEAQAEPHIVCEEVDYSGLLLYADEKVEEDVPEANAPVPQALPEDFSAQGLPFDRQALELNYRACLLNLFQQEAGAAGFNLISQPLLGECKRAIAEKDFAYLKCVLEILYRKIKADRVAEDIFSELERRVTNFIEGAAFKEELNPCLVELFGLLRKSFLGLDYYLDMVFNQGRVNPAVLGLFLKFFPADLPLFYARLEGKQAQVAFLARIVEGLIAVKSALALQMVKRIFYLAGEVIRIEIFRSMQQLGCIDEELAFFALEKGSPQLKKEAIASLRDNSALKKRAAEELLSISSPWGRRNNILLENMLLVQELDLRDAGDYLTALSKRRFFWNSNLRAMALSVLREWNVRRG